MKGTLTFLGTGGSAGIPMIGCHCEVCSSSDFRNKRLRPAALIELGGKTVVIDTGPDFRQQALNYNIQHLDAVLYTHTHYDHIAGIDELRIYYLNSNKSVKALVSQFTYNDLLKRYYYLFERSSTKQSLSAQLDFEILPHRRGYINFMGIPLYYMSYSQGGMEVTGYRIGDLAYISDIKQYEDTIFEDLRNVKTLILSAISTKPSFMHLSLDEAVEFAKKCGAQEVWITHISHNLDHESTNRYLPKGIQLAYDGCKLSFEY